MQTKLLCREGVEEHVRTIPDANQTVLQRRSRGFDWRKANSVSCVFACGNTVQLSSAHVSPPPPPSRARVGVCVSPSHSFTLSLSPSYLLSLCLCLCLCVCGIECVCRMAKRPPATRSGPPERAACGRRNAPIHQLDTGQATPTWRLPPVPLYSQHSRCRAQFRCRSGQRGEVAVYRE
jgi:hypothetical protein